MFLCHLLRRQSSLRSRKNKAGRENGNSFFARGSIRWPDARNRALHLAEKRDYLP